MDCRAHRGDRNDQRADRVRGGFHLACAASCAFLRPILRGMSCGECRWRKRGSEMPLYFYGPRFRLADASGSGSTRDMISSPAVQRITRVWLRRVATSVAWLILGIVISGCSKSTTSKKGSSASASDWVDTSEVSPEERTYLEYGRGVVQAVSAQNYESFYGQLSSHARARMSLNQFAPADDEAAFVRQEKQPVKDVALPRFLELMQLAEQRFGRPIAPLNLHVHTTEAAALS